MTKMGRPKSGDIQPGWMLFRMVAVLQCYQQQRRNGIKYRSAVSAAISYIRSEFPRMPISESTVKRILTHTQNQDQNWRWVIRPSEVPTPNTDGLSIGFEACDPYPTQHQMLRDKRLAKSKH